MKIGTYNGQSVISSEEFRNYLKTEKDSERLRTFLSSDYFARDIDYVHASPREAKAFGINKKYNYPQGLNLFLLASLPKVEYFDKAQILDMRRMMLDAGVVKPAYNPNPVNKNLDTNLNLNKGNPTVQMPFDQLFALVDTQMEKQAAFIKCLQESNERLVDEVSRLTGAVDSLMQVLTTTSVTIKSPQSESEILNVPALSESVFDVPLIIKEDTSYEEWKKAIHHALDLIIRDGNELTRSSILHDAYERIRAQYGIVWEQEAKEFKNEFERGPVNTKELCWWMETRKSTYKNLLIGKLNTIYSEVKRGKAV